MIEFKKEAALDKKIEELGKKLKYFSAIRLILGILFIVFLISLFSIGSITFIVLSILSFILLVGFMIYTNKFYVENDHLKKKKLVYTLHKKRRELQYASFYDTGSDFLNKDDYKLSDLDLFGKKSLYQYLCAAKTKLGRQGLAKSLTSPDKRDKEYTKCIEALANSEDVIDIEADICEFSADAKHLDYDEFTSLLGKKIPFKPIFLLPLLSFIGTIIFAILIPILHINPLYILIFLVLNLLSVRVLSNEAFSLNSTAYENICEAYIRVSKTIINTKIEDPYFKELQNTISVELNSLLKIKGIYSTLSCRKNAIFNLGLNTLFVVDFWILLRYNRINDEALSLANLFEAVGEVEVMLSLANIGIDNEVYCISEEADEIEGVEMYHPLVKGCVPNSIKMDGGIILTGSNMSGKTTFMRTLGINEILHNACGLVPAKAFRAPYLKVFTSLRANDMLSEGVSTFYAEILRMKRINEAITGERCLILIDEIFKGTNALERITASKKVIDKLNLYKAIFIISTHDFELCDSEGITNYHFSEHYKDDTIGFDYILKDGKCESKNALYLLKMSGII